MWGIYTRPDVDSVFELTATWDFTSQILNGQPPLNGATHARKSQQFVQPGVLAHWGGGREKVYNTSINYPFIYTYNFNNNTIDRFIMFDNQNNFLASSSTAYQKVGYERAVMDANRICLVNVPTSNNSTVTLYYVEDIF